MNDSKEHILLCSLRLFMQKGFKEVTMKEIVDETGFSKGALYHYFVSKEQVFAEVIAHFLADEMTTDYSAFPQDSLQSFYQAILEDAEKRKTGSSNYYYLIFDAMRILPDFNEQLIRQRKDELKLWKKVIAAARKKGEIRSSLSDDQVARLFLYTGDGLGLQSILLDNTSKARLELQQLWDGLYSMLV